MKIKTIYFLLTFICLIVLGLTSCNSTKTSAYNCTLDNPSLEFLWETDTILTDIESAIYDENKNMIYTTSINGHWLKKNGVGFVSKLSLKGNIIKHKWIDNLDGPTGTTIYNNKLYVADFENVIEIDIEKSKVTDKILVEGTERINDLAVSTDGVIYGTGTLQGKLFSIENKKVNMLKNDLGGPNGILIDGENILLGLGKSKSVDAYNLNSKSMKIFSDGISNSDGITAIGNGDYLVSSWQGFIHYVYKNGDKKLLLDTSKEGINAADICYIPSKKLLLVPAMLNHKLMAYRLINSN
jgi:hypothetical protein